MPYNKLTYEAMRWLQCSVYTFKQHVQSSYSLGTIVRELGNPADKYARKLPNQAEHVAGLVQ